MLGKGKTQAERYYANYSIQGIKGTQNDFNRIDCIGKNYEDIF